MRTKDLDVLLKPIRLTNFNTIKPMIPTPAHKDKYYKLKAHGTRNQEKRIATNSKNIEHQNVLNAPQNIFAPADKKEEEK